MVKARVPGWISATSDWRPRVIVIPDVSCTRDVRSTQAVGPAKATSTRMPSRSDSTSGQPHRHDPAAPLELEELLPHDPGVHEDLDRHRLRDFPATTGWGER